MHYLGRIFIAPDGNAGAARLLYVVAFKIWLAAVTEYVRKRAIRAGLSICDARAARQKKTAGVSPAVSISFSLRSISAQQLKHALLGLVGQRQRRDRDRLAGRQRLAVGRFLVGGGPRQGGRAGLHDVDPGL